MRSVLVSFDGLETSCLPVAEAVVNERDLRNRLESLWRIPSELQQIVWNGVRVADGTLLNVAGESFHTAAIKLRGGALKGGKGGFGSMLRSIGAKAAQKETTNFEACRDLNGQRLRNVHDQETMVDFLKKTEEREKEREELKKKKQEQLTRGPLHAFDHQAHGTEVRDAKEKVNEALNEALKKRKFEGDEEATASKKVKAKKLKIWGDDDDLSGSDSDSDSGSDGEKDEKAASLVTTTTSSTSTTATSKQTSLTAVEG